MSQMLSYAGNVSVQVVILFLLIGLGALLTKIKMLDQTGVKQITNIVIHFVTPAVIIKSFAGGTIACTPDNIKNLAVAAVAAVISHIVSILIGFAFFRKSKDKLNNLMVCTVMASNCGFMSLPLAEAIFGDMGVFMTTVYVGVFNIIIWTVGVRLISGEKMSVKKAFLNPGVIGVAVGIILFLCRVDLSRFPIIFEPVRYLAALNTPLPMIAIGYYLASTGIKLQKGDGLVLKASLLRLIVAPVAVLAVLMVIGISGDTLGMCVLPACAPVAVIVMMFAANYDGDAVISSRIVSLSHAISMITMPIIMTACKFFGG